MRAGVLVAGMGRHALGRSRARRAPPDASATASGRGRALSYLGPQRSAEFGSLCGQSSARSCRLPRNRDAPRHGIRSLDIDILDIEYRLRLG